MKVRYPDRVIYPLTGFRKRDIVDYYDRIAPVLLPHLRDRPVTLKRYPDQAQGEHFYEKDAPAFTPDWVQRFAVWRRSGDSQIHYIVINDARTLLWAASVGTIEIHPFLARIDDFNSPAQVVFDLDPGLGADILSCARVAFLLRDLLARLGLRSCAKVSGSKGLQLYVPLNSPTSYSATQPFARAVAELLGREHPREVTAVMEKAQRKDKVFIDWSQNADYKTTVAVYSLRAKRRHPYVSAPVSFDELQQAVSSGNAESLFFLPDAVLERVRRLGDLFAPVETLVQKLPEDFLRGLHLPASTPARRRTAGGAARRESPRASEQGGRRIFTAVKRRDGITLTVQVHDRARSWLLRGLPEHAGEAQPAKPVPPSRAGDLWDTGAVELVEGNPAKGYLDLYFSGAHLKGEYILRGNGEWEIIRPKAGRQYAPAAFLESPRRTARHSPVTPEEAKPTAAAPAEKSSSPLKFVTPMECLLADKVPAGREWLYELKLDGYRIIAVKQGARANIYSRRGTPFNDRFPHIAGALRHAQLPDCVLDGEIVALDEQGRPSFQELQNSRTSGAPIVYYVFDVLHVADRDLQRVPLARRKEILQTIACSFVDPVRTADVLETDAATLVAQVKRLGLEGVVAKRSDSLYESGRRSGAWVKFRVNEREDFVIGGYLPGRTGLDALLVGREIHGKLYFVKKVRNGFVPQTRREVLKAVAPLKTRRCPFVNLPEPSSRRGAVDEEQMRECVWVRPERRAEIEFAEKTAGGRLRHAAFRQLVDDRDIG